MTTKSDTHSDENLYDEQGSSIRARDFVESHRNDGNGLFSDATPETLLFLAIEELVVWGLDKFGESQVKATLNQVVREQLS